MKQKSFLLLVLVIIMTSCYGKEKENIRKSINGNFYESVLNHKITFTYDSCYFIDENDSVIDTKAYSVEKVNDEYNIIVENKVIGTINKNKSPFKMEEKIPSFLFFDDESFDLIDVD